MKKLNSGTEDEFIEDYFDETDDHELDLEDGEDHTDSDYSIIEDDDYDEDELERRRVAYIGLKKADKIYNNTYNHGYEAQDEDSDQIKSESNSIRIDAGSNDYYMYDSQAYSERVDLSIVQRDIFNFIDGNQEVLAILGNEPERKKFNKIEINSMFAILIKGLTAEGTNNYFISSIHVLDAISISTNMEYKKLFDMLTYEHKEILLVELNKTHNILDSMGKNYKMF